MSVLLDQLPLVSGMTSDDYIPFTNSPASTPVSNNITRANFMGGTNITQVVGTTETQTLTNKTLTSPKINEDVAITATATELNYTDGVTSAIQTQLDLKAALISPSFTTPSLGVATATSINKVAITAPTTSATLTIGDGLTLAVSTASKTLTGAGTSISIANALTFAAGTTGSITLGTGTDTLAFTTAGATSLTLPTTGTVATTAGTQTLTNKTITAPVIQQDWNMWITVTDTLVYGSASTVTIAGVDRTAIYTKGARVKLTQTTDKYFVVVSSSFSTNTTITFAVNTDYTVANAAITAAYYSYAACPAGYPIFFNRTDVTVVGSGGSIGAFAEISKIYRYSITGNMLYFIFKTSVTNKGSWSGTVQIGIPVTAGNANELFFGNCINQGVSWGTTGAIVNYGPAYPSSTNVLFKKDYDTNDVQWSDMTAQFGVFANGQFTF